MKVLNIFNPFLFFLDYFGFSFKLTTVNFLFQYTAYVMPLYDVKKMYIFYHINYMELIAYIETSEVKLHTYHVTTNLTRCVNQSSTMWRPFRLECVFKNRESIWKLKSLISVTTRYSLPKYFTTIQMSN